MKLFKLNQSGTKSSAQEKAAEVDRTKYNVK